MNGKCDWKRCGRTTAYGYRPRTDARQKELCDKHNTHMAMSETVGQRAYGWRKMGYGETDITRFQHVSKSHTGTTATGNQKENAMGTKTTKTKKASKRTGTKKVSGKKGARNGGGKLSGRTSGQSIREFACAMLQTNERAPRAKKLTDPQIQSRVAKEFPNNKGKQWSDTSGGGVRAFRGWYNRGGDTGDLGTLDGAVSHEFGKDGKPVAARRGRPSKNGAVDTPKKAATKKASKKSATKKAGAKVRRRSAAHDAVA